MSNSLLSLLAFVFLSPIAYANSSLSQIDQDVHQKCINARDYFGCTNVFLNSAAERRFTVFSTSDDPGKTIAEFQALKGNSECKVILYEKAADFCSDIVGRESIKSWSSYQIQAMISICVKDADISVKYLSEKGTTATTISFISEKAIKKFDSKFLAWSRIPPIRIEGNCYWN